MADSRFFRMLGFVASTSGSVQTILAVCGAWGLRQEPEQTERLYTEILHLLPVPPEGISREIRNTRVRREPTRRKTITRLGDERSILIAMVVLAALPQASALAQHSEIAREAAYTRSSGVPVTTPPLGATPPGAGVVPVRCQGSRGRSRRNGIDAALRPWPDFVRLEREAANR